MIAIIICALICGTVLLIVSHITSWLSTVSDDNKPLFIIEHRYKTNTESAATVVPVPVLDEQEEKKPTPKEQQEAIYRDAASTIATLLRGEVDFDEFGI